VGVVSLSNFYSMAVVKYGSLVTNIKGKLGGHVLQRCGQSNSIRTNAFRARTSSLPKMSSNLSMSVICSKWRSLTNAQRIVWSTIAPSYPTVDKYGNSIVLTGYQLFILINKRFALAGAGLITTGVTYLAPTLSDIDFNPFTIATTEFRLLWNYPIAAGSFVLLYVTEPVHNTRYISNPHYHYSTTINAGTAVNTNFYNLVRASMHTKPVVGDSFYWIAYKVDQASGIAIIDNGAQEIIIS
jgi:hypothetical protein